MPKATQLGSGRVGIQILVCLPLGLRGDGSFGCGAQKTLLGAGLLLGMRGAGEELSLSLPVPGAWAELAMGARMSPLGGSDHLSHLKKAGLYPI